MCAKWLAASAFILVFAIQAHADVVTYQVDFTSPGFDALNTPFPVSGSFTLTFDRSHDSPTVDGQNEFVTNNFVVNSFSYHFSQPLTVGYAYAATYGELYIVGATDLAGNPYSEPGFGLDFFNINSGMPLYTGVPGAVLAEGGITDLARGVDEGLESLDVTVTQLNTPVPEPSTFVLLAMGALGFCKYARWRSS